jgi:transcription attenuation protein (tryptophan RNA-binding attenuator protein)
MPGSQGREAPGAGGESILGDFIVVQALEDGVTVIGLTRGHETRFTHTEKLDRGEVWISQFTEHTSAMKIRGKARVLTRHGVAESGRGDHA